MDGPSDDELLAMFREGDLDAFDALFDRHHVDVYHFACLMLNGRNDAEDVLQDTFLAVARSARAYSPRGRFRPWLMRIARNLCLNRLHSERLRRRVLAADGDFPDESASGAPAAPELLEWDEGMRAVHEAVRALPERQREALALYAFEGMTYGEVSEALQAPMGTVKALIHRARAALALALNHDQGAQRDDV
ncbi:MAG: RNA polymerase sigma factor [Candidatus Brocadiaceae bacterium]|nr:RNA polymerase sigma factor [Candidatus Brocadiaceae bacterium]